MQMQLFSYAKAKPILKWAGGKTQLLEEISENLPVQIRNKKIKRYVEAFVGGGALFFFIAQAYQLEEYVLADINNELILLYKTVQKSVDELVNILARMEEEYLIRDHQEREKFYYSVRESFNSSLAHIDFHKYGTDWIKRASQIIFLNRTCFNGLFRVNSKGFFNVPFGRYANPTICDESNLHAASIMLQKAVILSGDFTSVAPHVDASTFVYFDPPYRPISKTASFNSYAKDTFGDNEQLRLAEFYRMLDSKGAKLMLSNSDPKNIDPEDNFFDEAYQEFTIKRVKATRVINSNADKRGEINELLITNY